MIIPNDDLRTLCIKNDWFTCGSNRQYNKLFYANRMGAPIEEIATIIWVCSDDEVHCRRSILENLKKAQKEYDELIEQGEDAMYEHIARGERTADEVYCGYYD